MIHELSLSEYVEKRRATLKPVRVFDFRAQFYPDTGRGYDLRSSKRTDSMDCECASCRPMDYPMPAIAASVNWGKGVRLDRSVQLELWK